MARKKDDLSPCRIDLPRTSALDLKGKQSVRATFKLSETTIDVLSIVSSHLGLKQKSLFDYLVEDEKSLEAIAQGLKEAHLGAPDRIQKTLVISRKSLFVLEEISKSYSIPRDTLVEFSVQRLKPIIEKEKEKLERRKKYAENINAQLKQQKRLLNKVIHELGEKDPLCKKLEQAVLEFEKASLSIEGIIKMGEKMIQLNLP